MNTTSTYSAYLSYCIQKYYPFMNLFCLHLMKVTSKQIKDEIPQSEMRTHCVRYKCIIIIKTITSPPIPSNKRVGRVVFADTPRRFFYIEYVKK